MKLSDVGYFEKKDISTFIYSVHSKAWTKADTELQVSRDNTDVITVRDGVELEAVLLLKEVEAGKFYCSLAFAKTTEAFGKLAQKLQEEYPNHEVVAATRRGKLVTYKNPKKFLDKIRNFYG